MTCMSRATLLALALLLGGCTQQRIATMAEALNSRQVSSCIWVTGGYGMFASVRLVTATGGQPLAECLRH